MKIATERNGSLDDGLGRTPSWFHHVDCDCGVTIGHDPRNGNVVTCPNCKKTEEVAGAGALSVAAQARMSNAAKK